MFSQQIANTTAIAKNKVKEMSFGYIGMAVVSLVISFILCKKYGALGSAVAITLAYFVLFIYLNIIYYKHLKINVFEFFKKCYMKFIPSLALSGVLGYFISNKVINIQGRSGLIFKGIIVCALYFVCVLVIGFNKKDRNNILNFIKIKLHKT